jgi:hypothetical protein
MTDGRIFVPLTGEAFEWFSRGGKRFELRRARSQFTERFVQRGRRVQLRKGYSGPSMNGRIGRVVTAPSLAAIFESVPYTFIIPDATSKVDAFMMASRYVGEAGPFIAFEVLLDEPDGDNGG